jgi:hypothetical protein
VATILGFLKGKSSIWIAQNIANKPRNFAGHKFWARGYFVSTVGANEKVIRADIENQEKEDKRLNDLFDLLFGCELQHLGTEQLSTDRRLKDHRWVRSLDRILADYLVSFVRLHCHEGLLAGSGRAGRRVDGCRVLIPSS